jgi:hypothetical protein
VVCLIKIDGILFGKNTSTLDMKIVQIKVIKTEKIPSEDDYVDQQPSMPSEKPFYNDNASVIPHNFSEQKRPVPIVTDLPPIEEKESMIEKVDELHYVGEHTDDEKRQLQDMIESEKIIEKIVEKVPEPPPSPVRTVITQPVPPVQSVPQQSVPQQSVPPISMDSIKCEIMKAMTDNDFQRVKELSTLLQKHKI